MSASDVSNMNIANDEFLAGKSAIVTGSTSGIGLGIARRLAAAGANVMVNGLGDQSQLDAAVQSVSDAGSGDV